MIIPSQPLPPGTQQGQIITLIREDSFPRNAPSFAGVWCNEKGGITLWNARQNGPDRTNRDNSYHHNIKGLNQGHLEFGGKKLLDFKNEWFDWTFHPNGVLICFENRLVLVVLLVESAP